MTASAPPWPGLADLPVRERLIVRFDAQTAGSGALTWGQRRVAALNAQLHPHEAPLNLRFAFPLAPGASAADVVAALGRAIESCEALRTRYPWHDPESTQTVCAQGELPCPVLEAPTLDTPYAFGLADELADAPFRDDDWPLRVAVVSGGVHGPRCLLFVVSHIAIDFFGIDFLLWHLRAVLPPGPGRAIDPGPSPAQPRDLAAWESGPEGQHEARRAIERHTRALTRMPQSMLPRIPIEPLTPRYRYLEMRSHAASLCLAHLSALHKVSETAVFTAILATLLSTAGGVDRCQLQLCVANRLRGHSASAVATLTQDVPICLDVAGKDVAGLIRHCAGTVVTATTQGRYPPEHLEHARRTVEHHRGLALDLSYWLNSRLRPTTPTPNPPQPNQLQTALRHTTITETGADTTSSSTVFTYIERHNNELLIRIMTDTAYVTPTETTTWLHALETMLLTTLTNPTTPPTTLANNAGIPTPQRNHEWTTINHSPIHLPTTTHIITQALQTPTHLTPDPTRQHLIAHTPESRNPEQPTTLNPDLIRNSHIAAIPKLHHT